MTGMNAPPITKRTPIVVCPRGINAKNANNATKGPHSRSIAGRAPMPSLRDNAMIAHGDLAK
jgi:hypothetical protein